MSNTNWERVSKLTREECERELGTISRISGILAQPYANTHSSEWRYMSEWEEAVKARIAELEQKQKGEVLA